jgi:hypothetical protein
VLGGPQQVPPQQVCPAWQGVAPQAPQLFGSVWVLVQVPSQQVFGGAQVVPPQLQTPASQVCPAGQAMQEGPQLLGSVWVLVQVPPQQVCPAWQGGAPQAPQLFGSVWVLVQVPLQQVLGGPQQVPPQQVCPVRQALPQLPQLLGSV